MELNSNGTGNAEVEFADDEEFLDDDVFAGESLDSARADAGAIEFVDDSEFATDLDGEMIQGEATLSPDMLMQMSFDTDIDLGKEDDSDLQEINTIVDSLNDAGIENVDQMKYDDLVSMLQRAERLKDESACVRDLIDHTRSMLSGVIDDVGSIEATLEGDQGSKDNYTDMLMNLSINFDSTIDGALHSYIMQTVYAQYFIRIRHGRDPADITVDDVYHLIRPSVSESFPDIDDKELVQYLSTVIPITVAKISSDNQREEMVDKRRKYAAIMLLQQDLQETQGMLSAEPNSIRVIRQMFKDDRGNYYYKCRQCGELIKIDGTMLSIIAFPTERGVSKKFFPKMSVCKCGCKHVLCEEDYVEIMGTYLDARNSLLNRSVQTVSGFCKGAAFVRVEPESKLLEDAMPYLFTSVGEGVDSSDSPAGSDGLSGMINDDSVANSVRSEAFELQIDRQEFFEAVRRFYDKLSGLGSIAVEETDQDDEDDGWDEDADEEDDEQDDWDDDDAISIADGQRLDWQTVAKFVCQCSGVNYSEVKNKAIFSLLSRFQENPYFKEILDMRRIWDLQMMYARVCSLGSDPAYFSKIEVCQLSSLASTLEKIDGGNLESLEYKQYLYSVVKGHENQLKTQIEEMLEKHRSAIDSIHWYAEEYGFSKILNVGNYNLSDFEGYFGDEQLVAVIDEVSDRVIVTNYADDFYRYWARLGFIRKNNLTTCLSVRSDVSNASRILKQAVVNMLGKTQCFVMPDFTQCFSYDSRVYDILYRMYVHYKNYDYYKFCVEFVKLDINEIIRLPSRVKTALNSMVLQLGDEAKTVTRCSEYEFYLKDFTLSELEGKKVLLDTLTFGRYVPKRLPDETIEEYVHRVNTQTEEWNAMNSYDTYEYFMHFNTYAPVIGCCTNRKEIEFESYAASMFMYLLICMSMDHGLSGFKAIGGTEFTLNKLRADQAAPLSDVVHLCEGTYKVLHNDYTTSIANKMKGLAFRYDNMTLTSYDALTPESKFSLRDVLLDVYVADYYAVDDDGVPINDKEDVIAEIESCLGSCPEMTQKEIVDNG